MQVERDPLGIAPRKEGGEDHDGLRGDGTGQMRLAFDVDHAAPTHEGAGGDAAGRSKGGIAQRHDRESVDLAHTFALHGNEHRAASDLVAQPFLEAIPAQTLFGDCLLHICGHDQIVSIAAGPIRTLGDEVSDVAEPCGEVVLILHQPRAVVDDAGYGCRREGAEVLLPAHHGDELGVFLDVLGVAGHAVVEIGLDLEQLVEVLIVVLQQIVQVGRSRQHHLDSERNGLRLQHGGGDQPQRLRVFFHPHDALLQCPLEGVPGLGAFQQGLCFQHQIAAVGAVQDTGPDHGEVGDQGAHHSLMLHPPHQIGEVRIAFVYHRRALGVGVVHKQVDAVAPHDAFGAGHLHGRGQIAILAGALEGFDV